MIGQGHPRVITGTECDGPVYPVLQTKIHGNLSTGSREEDFMYFTINGHGGHLDHVTISY